MIDAQLAGESVARAKPLCMTKRVRGAVISYRRFERAGGWRVQQEIDAWPTGERSGR